MSVKVHPEMMVSGESHQGQPGKEERQEVGDAEEEEEEQDLNEMKALVQKMRESAEARRLQSQQRRAAVFVKAQTEEKRTESKHGHESWQHRLLHCLHHHYFQGFLIFLLLIDVVVVVVELFLEAQYPDCDIIKRDAVSCVPKLCIHNTHGSASSHSSSNTQGSSSSHGRRIAGLEEEEWQYGRDSPASWLADESLSLRSWESRGRLLSGDSHHGPECENKALYSPLDSAPATCDKHKYGWLHTLHSFLVGLSCFILGFFLLELVLLFSCLGCGFFKNPLYIADFTIVSISLILEFVLMSYKEQSLVSLLLFARFWRFVRVAHGLITSVHEPMSHQLEQLEEDVERLSASAEKLTEQKRNLVRRIDFLTKDLKDPKAAKAAAAEHAAKTHQEKQAVPAKPSDPGPRAAAAPEAEAAVLDVQS